MIKLSDISTKAPKGTNKKEIRAKTKVLTQQIADLQNILYAQRKYAVLIVFQGMDSSGKDGATRNVFSKCSPSAVSAKSFKKPTEEEFAHDFLWRAHKVVPQKGEIKIFNRSHYEDVLIQRVHKWIDEDKVTRRIESINAFEQLLQYDNNTLVLKFYMHLSKDRQKEKLQERIDEPRKNWKHNPGDWEQRKHWDEYRRCYEDVINRSAVPWHVVPVDQRWYRDYIIAKTVVEEMRKLDLVLPGLPKEDG